MVTNPQTTPEDVMLRAGVAAYQELVLRSRVDFHTFVPFVLRDDRARPVDYSLFHRLLGDFVDDCWTRGYYAGILGPVQWGKSLVIVEGRLLWEIGRDPNLRARIVSGSDDESVKRVMTVKRYIESGDPSSLAYDRRMPEFRDVFPQCVPAPGEPWADHKIFVKRTSPGRDPTLEASPVIGIRAGASHDILVFDDPVTAHNTIYNPGMRLKVYESIGFWLQRLQPQTRVLMVGFRHHQQDAYAKLMAEGGERWRWLIVRVSDDCAQLEARVESQTTMRDRSRR
jgi:hypothetical protein